MGRLVEFRLLGSAIRFCHASLPQTRSVDAERMASADLICSGSAGWRTVLLLPLRLIDVIIVGGRLF